MYLFSSTIVKYNSIKFCILAHTINKYENTIIFCIKKLGGFILDNNRKVTKEKVTENKKTFISEVQEFKEPVGYKDAFNVYYPEDKRNLYKKD